MNDLQVQWAHIKDRNFLDFLVDGVSLGERLGRDWVTPLCREWTRKGGSEWVHAALRGQGRSELDGRVELLVCADCGSINCGALTCRMEIGKSTVTWSDFAYQKDREHIDRFEWPAVAFDRKEYEELLSEAMEQVWGEHVEISA